GPGLLACGRRILQRHPRPGKDHSHPLRSWPSLHGVHRSRNPQRPDRPNGGAAAL
ncbi:uncharacterized protein METZ01_LOCUS422892, partial [marine metagenome]